MVFPHLEYEGPFWNENHLVAGVDEAGRGPLAGPVVAAAVIIEPGSVFTGLNDSKKMTEKARLKLYEQIYKNALDVSVGIIDNIEIDEINILQASVKAMKVALDGLRLVPKHIFIDGNYFTEYDIPYTTIVKGDSTSLSIAAASVIAKVTRDNWMVEKAAQLYPEYGFDKHKGYPTDFHIKAIEKFGHCPIHRKTFLKNIVIKQETLF
ncbi:MAG: ribonuclease HII [Candidatus Kapabacteria bacterium]|nr:ribonuclease HII [Ignavibacteriota bacterium]MCW5886164.1 ribonuclease HII [Candidatus Kapabacteria bacterium]